MSPTDVALSNFVKALALPVRICLVRFILENGNAISRMQLSDIPYNRLTVNQHINELKKLDIIKVEVKDKENFYSVNESVFIRMSNHFLTLFEPIRQLNEEANLVFSKPKIKNKPAKKTPVQIPAFGDYLRDKRKHARLSQATLAGRIKMDRGWISKVEANKQIVKAEKLGTLAEALDTPLAELSKVYYQCRINQLTQEGLELKDA